MPSTAFHFLALLALLTVFVSPSSSAPNLRLQARAVSSTTASSAPPTSSSSGKPPALGQRATLGLFPDALQKNSIYVGVFPDWSRETPTDIFNAVGTEAALIGDYLNISPNDTSLSQLDYHRSEILKYKDVAVYNPAVLPPGVTPGNFTQAMADALAQAFKGLEEDGMTSWVRFAYEMNGAWMPYGLQPTDFKNAWSMLRTSFASAGLNKTFMVWSPNVVVGDAFKDPLQTYSTYYVGDDQVDVVGLSAYFLGDLSQSQNVLPTQQGKKAGYSNSLTANLDQFYKMYSHKPVMISETSAAYHYAMPANLTAIAGGTSGELLGTLPSSSTLTAAAGGAPELQIKQAWFEQLTGEEAAGRYPHLIAVNWFNIFKVRATVAGVNQLDDFRAVGGNADVQAYFRQAWANSTSYDGRWTNAVGAGPAPPFAADAKGVIYAAALAVAVVRFVQIAF